MAAVERDLLAKYRRVDYWRSRFEDSTVSASDSVEKANIIFQRALIRVCSTRAGSLNYPFKSLADSGITIATSADHRFRVYSWDNEEGGTMRFHLRVYQWLGGNRVHAKAGAQEEEDDPGVFCTPIFTLNTPGNVYYLVINTGIYSSKDLSEGIQAVRIDGTSLNDSVRIFKTSSRLANTIEFFYDYFSVLDSTTNQGPGHLIQYDSAQRIVRIPVVLEDGKVTKRWITYQWTGRYFERRKNPS